MDYDTFSVMLLGLSIGIFHAFDADHVVAMSAYVNKESKYKAILGYAVKWGAGHGGILLALGLAIVLLGIGLPQWFVFSAEVAVGFLLIYLGVRLCLHLMRPNKLKLASPAITEGSETDIKARSNKTVSLISTYRKRMFAHHRALQTKVPRR